jgi:hypothetical protein
MHAASMFSGDAIYVNMVIKTTYITITIGIAFINIIIPGYQFRQEVLECAVAISPRKQQ